MAPWLAIVLSIVVAICLVLIFSGVPAEVCERRRGAASRKRRRHRRSQTSVFAKGQPLRAIGTPPVERAAR